MTKRSASDADFKELVISNVEFCMLQFYKSHSEAAAKRIGQQQREIKKLKLDNERESKRVRELVNANVDLLTEINAQADQLGNTQEHLHHAIIQREAAVKRLMHAEGKNIQYNVIINNMIDKYNFDNDDIAVFQELGLPVIMPYDSDEETEPDMSLYM